MMTKQHFEVVAAAVANIHPRRDRWMIANLLANTFEQYPRFDRDRFIAACRPTGSPGGVILQRDELN